MWKCYGNLKIIEKNTYNDESFKNYYSAMQEETKKFWKTRMLEMARPEWLTEI